MGRSDVVLFKWYRKLPKEFIEELDDALAWDEAEVWMHGFSVGVDSAVGAPQYYLKDRLLEVLTMTLGLEHVVRLLEEALDDIKYIQTCLKSEVSQYVYNILKNVHARIDEAIDMLRKEADER